MKLYTNENNTISLKILIGCEIMRENVTIEFVHVEGEADFLSYLFLTFY